MGAARGGQEGNKEAGVTGHGYNHPDAHGEGKDSALRKF